jgi:hypothetical protein
MFIYTGTYKNNIFNEFFLKYAKFNKTLIMLIFQDNYIFFITKDELIIYIFKIYNDEMDRKSTQSNVFYCVNNQINHFLSEQFLVNHS